MNVIRLFEQSFSVAPMLDMTDRHCRAFLRLLSKRTRLYTEMMVTGSLIHGDRDRFLLFDSSEHPVAIQLGGSDPQQLALCAGYAEERGYDEVNLNVGCPSDRVKNGSFGACLMAKPELVAECVGAMIAAVNIPVTVKTRIGIDDLDSYEALQRFIQLNIDAGCEHFIIHARKAWLQGLSPKQNRTVPPLHYDRVYQLKADFPDIKFSLNGGITSLAQAEEQYRYVDGVMVGRQAYHDPWILTEVDRQLFGEEDTDIPQTRLEAIERFMPYIERELSSGVFLRHMTRHMLQLFHGQAGAKGWRRYLSEHGPRKGAGIEVIEQALKFVEQDDSTSLPATSAFPLPHAVGESASL
ncbi:MAG: tRNA dihydrouridine(20/20a) synthase DusA [Acidiferrobacterales bacterium]|nr:tRNA dihydrouridine(20/20a) synthase DusA [Acidiferrobacterales bacterium]